MKLLNSVLKDVPEEEIFKYVFKRINISYLDHAIKRFEERNINKEYAFYILFEFVEKLIKTMLTNEYINENTYKFTITKGGLGMAVRFHMQYNPKIDDLEYYVKVITVFKNHKTYYDALFYNRDKDVLCLDTNRIIYKNRIIKINDKSN